MVAGLHVLYRVQPGACLTPASISAVKIRKERSPFFFPKSPNTISATPLQNRFEPICLG